MRKSPSMFAENIEPVTVLFEYFTFNFLQFIENL
jgi:hypothetical protein